MFGNNYYNPFGFGAFRPRTMGLFGNSLNSLHGASATSGKFLSNLFHKFNLNSFLTGTSKTLNVINQAIPIYYQVKPMFSNAKTMFKIFNAVKDDNNTQTYTPNYNHNTYNNSNNINKQNNVNNNSYVKNNYENPKFFI